MHGNRRGWLLVACALGGACGSDDEGTTVGGDSGAVASEDGDGGEPMSGGDGAPATSGGSSAGDAMGDDTPQYDMGGRDSAGDPTDTAGDPTDSDSAGDDGGTCAPAACTTYASKMQQCYPALAADWYAECLDIYDICDIGGFCVDGVPGIIACTNSTPCEDVVDGACIGESC